MAKKKVWRISLVKMLYGENSRKTSKTPDPFCEIRCFVFSHNKPTIREEKLYVKGLEAVINVTENIFLSIVDAKKKGGIDEDEAEWSKLAEEPISIVPPSPPIEMEIDGMEVEEVDVDEVRKFFKGDSISTDELYRYVAFFRPDGSINLDYDEDEIKRIERTS